MRTTEPKGANGVLPVEETKPPHSLRGFWTLFCVQFQGAFSDNFFKFLVIFFAGRGVTTEVRDERIFYILLAATLPFILFAMTSGSLSDRFSKGRVITWTKLLEVTIMGLGTYALFTQSFYFMLAVMFLMSLQSTIFSPAKYSSLPELLPEWRLSWGNGFLGLGTFVSIIAGGIAAGVFSKANEVADFWSAGLILIGLAVFGMLLSFLIPRIPAASPGKKIPLHFLSGLGTNLKIIRSSRMLTLAIVGCMYFWLIAALIDPTMLVYGEDLLNLKEDKIAILRAFLAIGIAIGSVLAGFLSGRKIEYGLVPLGSLGLSVFACLLAIPGLNFATAAFFLFGIGLSGGFFIVPVNALIQHIPDRADKGSVMAANGWLNSIGALLAALLFYLLKSVIGLEANSILLVIGISTIAATIYAIRLAPDSLARLFLWTLTHTLYRVRVLGRPNVPEKGGALLVSNHLSMADALFVIASTDRQIRFIMHRDQFNKWWVRPIAKMLKVIPIASDLPPRELLKALKQASKYIEDGELVCIFAEGEISRIGQVLPFQKGIERIMKGVDAPIIPVHLDNVWGSIFSYQNGKVYWKIPRQIPYPISVSFGAPMPPKSKPHEVRNEVVALGAEAWDERKRRMPTVGKAFVRTARRARRRFAFADSSGAKMSFIGALTKTLFLAKRLRKPWAGQERVGLLLPPSAGGALTNFAGLLMGKTVVNLNYTQNEDGLQSCIEQCGIERVITSQKVIDKFGFDLGVPQLTLEELAAKPGLFEKLSAAAMAWLCPRWLLLRIVARGKPPGIDDIATVVFSSGSTGEPKGAMLSHYNVVSNMLQLNQVFDFKRDDRFVGVLPFFHSLGFTCTLVGPALLGIGAAYHPIPTDARTVAKLVVEHDLTLLLATPTFLNIYIRGCEAGSFGGLRLVVVGAEKMPLRLATDFSAKFGITPLEAYGCTECAPGVAVNAPGVRGPNVCQNGNRPGTIGQALPGVKVKIVDPETNAPCGFGEPGLMWVKGPNIMPGYLGRSDLTKKVLLDGWYNTGDVVAQDEDGFLTITDRLSRFSKIGGEMVPHIKIEEVLQDFADRTDQCFAVTCLPDEKKGEKLAVLHTLGEDALSDTLGQLAESELPNLWKPKGDAFFKVDALPYLGTGKLDLRAIKTLAAERSADL